MTTEAKDTLFENIFKADNKLIMEVCSLTYPKVPKIICYTLFPVLILFGLIVFAIKLPDIDLKLILFLSICICALFIPSIRIRYDAKRLMSLFKDHYTDAGMITSSFYYDRFYYNYLRTNENAQYKQIKKIVIGDIGLYIILRKNALAFIKKDSFTKGDYGTFIMFLREKVSDNPKVQRGLK